MPNTSSEPARLRRFLGLTLALIIVAASIAAAWMYFARVAARPLSEDAVITAEVARMASSVPGRLTQLHVSENSRVAAGDVLFSVDPTFYELQVAQARAGVAVAQAGLGTRGRTLQAERSNTVIADEQVRRARINLAQTTQTLQRLQALLPKGYVTAQQVDDATTLKRNAETSLKEAQAQLSASKSLVGDEDAAMALLQQSEAALAIAQRQLDDTEVRAPNDGLVGGLTAAVGDYVIPAQSLFTLIDTTHWYASATFLETSLSAVTIGDCATVYVAADRTRELSGVVESIGWGVSSEDIIHLPRSLPYVPKALNWVRVGQRFPVRIRLDSPPPDLMRVGASATVMIRHGQRC